jgi:ribonucleoside-diphosphate reductase alpha chain
MKTRPARERLPNRRSGETIGLEFAGHHFSLTVSRFADGRIGEVFVRSAKPSSELDRLAGDVGVLVSLLLQHGVRPAQINHSLGRLDGGPAPASVIGAVIGLLVARED